MLLEELYFLTHKGNFPSTRTVRSLIKHTVPERESDVKTERENKGDVLSREATEDCNAGHKPACHPALGKTYNTHSVLLTPQGATACDCKAR